jgi:type II secretory pathway component PulL
MAKALFIDITDKEINTYIFDVGQGRCELKENRKYPLTEKYDFPAYAIAGGFDNVYLSLPASLLNFRVLDTPFSDRERIREVLPFELDGIILGGTDKALFDDIIVGRTESKHQALAVYIEKSVVRNMLAKLNSCGADPVFITSLEVGKIVKDFSPEKLLSPLDLDDNERIALAREEILSPTINLRREEFAYTRDIEKTKRYFKTTAFLVMLIAFVVSAGLLFQIITTKNEIAALKNDMRKKYQELFPQEKNIMNEVYQLKAHMKELSGKEEIFIGVSPLDVLWKLSQIGKTSAVFYETSTDKGNLILKGEAASLSDVQKVKDELGKFFEDVNISDSKTSVQGKMLFTITAKEKRA